LMRLHATAAVPAESRATERTAARREERVMSLVVR
jgi:hypothetical protein